MDVLSQRNPVEALADDFVERLRRGERPNIGEYAEEHPHLAVEIRELFPALEILQQVAEETEESTPAGPAAWHPPVNRHVGDYRLLRVLGHGGMGIVYEAVQESLGRRVALKILSQSGRLDEKYTQRFRREAQSAARLHHTNIVPVYDFGEEDGVHYYAMQYIHGRGLDEVLVEVRRHHSAANGHTATLPAAQAPPGASRRAIAHSMVTGAFTRSTPPACDGDRRRTQAAYDGASQEKNGRGNSGIEASLIVAAPASDTLVDAAGTATTPLADVDVHSLSGTGAAYWQSVASIGQQAAEALDYAHQQGVLHRDVKPGNLLLGVDGRVWVTDFGLAKAEDERDLTKSGDILGTLRYLPPESLSGKSDERSDVYSLGLTLYELAAFRAAFDQVDRGQLVRAVAGESPPRLSHVRPEIPRDLETVIHKAIDRVPAARYASAAALADDLCRFMRAKPVRARRISPLLRLARWTYRNPLVAALSAAVMLLVFAGLIATSLASIRFSDLAESRRTAQQKAEQESLRAIEESERAHDAERLALERLYAAHVAEATARQASGQPGQRFEALRAIREAAHLAGQLGYGDDQRLALRNLAIASLAVPDLQVEEEWQALPVPDAWLDFSPDIDRYAFYDGQSWAVEVRQVDDRAEVGRVVVPRRLQSLRLTDDGQRLRLLMDCKNAKRGESHQHLHTWEIGAARYAEEEIKRFAVAAFELASGEGTLVVRSPPPNDVVALVDEASGKVGQRFPEARDATFACLSPSGDRVAVAKHSRHHVEVYDVQSSELSRVVPLAGEPRAVTHIAWHPSGDYLAVACGFNVQVCHARLDLRPLVLKGHLSVVTYVTFDRDGDLLFSTGWDRQTRVWSAHDTRLLLTTDGNIVRVGETGRQAAFRHGTRLGIWRLAPGGEYRVAHAREAEGRTIKHAAVHPAGHLLATSGQEEGIVLWDAARLVEVAVLPVGHVDRIVFDPAGNYLLHTNPAGLFRWPIQQEEEEGTIEYSLGPRQQVELPPIASRPHHLAMDAAGTILATDFFHSGKLVVAPLDAAEEPLVIDADVGLMYVDVSPDGRWVATGNYHGRRAEVFDTRTGESVLQIADHRVSPAFSPDGRYFVVNEEPRLRVFEVGTWREIHPLAGKPAEGFEYISHPVFSPATPGLLAVAARDFRGIVLLDIARGEHVATLRAGPGTAANQPYCFSRDGSKLYLAVEGKSLGVWDLGQVRRGLAEVGLDWSGPPLRDASSDTERPRIRATVEVQSS